MSSPLRISIIDPDDESRAPLARSVARYPECVLHSQHRSAEEALAALPQTSPDVALIDIPMPDMDGIECLRRLKQQWPEADFLILTNCEQPESVFNALAAGANGYLLKRTTSREELRAAVFEVRSGGAPMTSSIARIVVESFHRIEPREDGSGALTRREQEVLTLLSQGHLYKEIAATLTISYETVHNHIRRIYEKLQVRSRSQAVAKYYGSRNGRG